MKGPFLTPKEAARYCGYETSTFRRLAKDYRIPKYGPGAARYATSDLDEWMQNVFVFINVSSRQMERSGFKKII
jgi:excisionase family DNA binding protein